MRILAMTNLYPNPYQPHRATFNRHQFRLLGQGHDIRVIAPVLWTDARRAVRSSIWRCRRSTAAPSCRDRRASG